MVAAAASSLIVDVPKTRRMHSAIWILNAAAFLMRVLTNNIELEIILLRRVSQSNLTSIALIRSDESNLADIVTGDYMATVLTSPNMTTSMVALKYNLSVTTSPSVAMLASSELVCSGTTNCVIAEAIWRGFRLGEMSLNIRFK